jgi:hypothetical protein
MALFEIDAEKDANERIDVAVEYVVVLLKELK